MSSSSPLSSVVDVTPPAPSRSVQSCVASSLFCFPHIVIIIIIQVATAASIRNTPTCATRPLPKIVDLSSEQIFQKDRIHLQSKYLKIPDPQIFQKNLLNLQSKYFKISDPPSEQIFHEYLLNQSKYLNCEMSNQIEHIRGQILYLENLEYWEYLIKNIIWQIPSLEFLYITG